MIGLYKFWFQEKEGYYIGSCKEIDFVGIYKNYFPLCIILIIKLVNTINFYIQNF